MIRLIFLTFLVLTLMSACIKADMPSPKPSDQQQISMAVFAYVNKHAAISAADITVKNIIHVGNYARANIIPIKPVTDHAVVFLQQSSQGWSVLSIGTAFDEAFYQKYHIPKILQI
jgi:hypothetical protein